MNITKNIQGENCTLTLEGRLDTTTSPALEGEIGALTGVKNLVLDFSGIEYISSAGLRVLLATQKRMKENGSLVLKNVAPAVKEVFDITGFSDILTVQ